MGKVKYGSRTYKKNAIEVASAFAPKMYPCPACGRPVARGYICIFCEHDSSDDLIQEPEYLDDIFCS